MQRVVIISAIFVFLSHYELNAQQLLFKDKLSSEPIEGLVVDVKSLSSGYIESVITNESGSVNVDKHTFPILIKTSHLGYKALLDTLLTSANHVFHLEPSINHLGEVIVTGQFSPRSLKHSVFRVSTLDKESIQRRGAVSLSEALKNSLNIRINQDLALGSASVSMQGISGQNVKVLVDGVPLVNRNGNGNGVDLSQVSLSNVERVEVVEGPMAVNFGANALAGVINLITKRYFDFRTEIDASIQTESAGSEYGLDKGKHIKTVNLKHRINDKWVVLLGGQRVDFQGFKGGAGKRQYEWNPKEQWLGNGVLKYEDGRHNVFYRFDGLNELISDFGTAQNNFLPSGENQPFAIDETYRSRRISHQLQANGRLSFLDRYTVFVSHSDFERQKRRFARNLITKAENLTSGEGDQDLSTYKVWELGGTGFLNAGDKIHFQLGYQISFERAGGGRIEGNEQGIEDYNYYASAEWSIHKLMTLRPGLRFTINNAFGKQLTPSLQLKFDLTDRAQLRLSYGRGYRTPSVRELYFEFVDSNHRIFGNPNLKSEKSNHLSFNFTSDYQLRLTKIKIDLSLFFNDISQQISLGQDVNNPANTTFLNINRFKTLGLTISQQAQIGSLSGSIGVSYIGRYNRISEQTNDLLRFFYSPELNANLSYDFRKEVSINLFYKYTGRVQSYFTRQNDQGEQVITIGQIDGYHWLDATVLFAISKQFKVTTGIKNLINVTRIGNSSTSGNAHTSGSLLPVSYGRSYFLKLSYNLNIK